MTMNQWTAGLAGMVMVAGALQGAAQGPHEFLTHDALRNAGAAITAAAFPDADDVLVDDYTRVIYADDGTAVTWGDSCVKVLTDKGARDNRTLSLRYNLSYGTAIVDLVEIIKPDGSVQTVDIAAQSRVMIDDSQMSQNIYDPNDKILRVGIPGLEPGDMCRYVLRRITSKARMPNTFSDYTVFEYTSPIIQSTYEIWGPARLPLVCIELKAPVSNTVQYSMSAAGGTNFYRWDVRNVPRMFTEPNMPALHTVVQRLLVSTIPDWQTVSRWYDGLCEPRLAAVTPAMSNFVQELTAPLTNERARLEAIFYYVSQKIRYMGITTETEAPGYEPHDVCVTFDNKYGVCRDKAALLAVLLRLAGFKAYPVLIYAGPKKDPEVPQPFFNHAITCVENDDGSYTLMDATDENTKELLPAYLCDKSYLVAKPDGDTLRVSPIVPADENMLRITTSAVLTREGTLRAESTLAFDGINDNAYRSALARMKPVERRQVFEGFVKRVAPGARLLECVITPAELRDMAHPLHVKLQFEARDFAIKGDHTAMLPPLWFGTSVGMINFVLGTTGLEERNYPLETRYACGVEERVTLTLGDALGPVRSLPACEGVDTSNLLWQMQMNVHEGVLDARAAMQMRTVEFSPAEYAGLKAVLKTIEFDRRKRAIFAAQAADTAADIAVHAAVDDVEIMDAHSLRAVSEVKKEILTYAGKKANAELKFSFNPVWESVTLVYARVTAPDGTVRAIGADELNLMDASWVGAAPRYPAAKVLVANLPGVEIGSIIEYRVERTQEQRPFVALAEYFRGGEPVVYKRLTCRVSPGVTLARRFTPGGRVDEQVTTNADVIAYVWQVTNQPAVKSESDQPPWWQFNPGVLVSLGAWPEYAARVHAVLQQAASGQTGAMARARDIAAGAATPRARIRAVRDFISKNIRQAGPAFTALPLDAITPADVTLRDGYGNSADRAALYVSMLTALDLAPELVLASTEPRIARLCNPRLGSPQRGVFSTVLVRVPCGKDTLYLNDTDQYAELGVTRHDGRPALLLPSGKLDVIRAARQYRNRTDLAFDVALTSQGDALITRRRTFYGTAFGAFHRQYAEMPPEQRRRHYLELVAGIAQSARAEGDLLTRYDRYPGVEQFTVRVPRYAVRDGWNLYCTLPAGALSLPGLRADTRTTPYYWDADSEMTITTRVLAPARFAAPHLLPANYTWYAPNQSGYIRCSSSWHPGATNTLTVSQDVRLQAAIIAADDYPALLDANRRLTHAGMRTVLLSSDEATEQ